MKKISFDQSHSVSGGQASSSGAMKYMGPLKDGSGYIYSKNTLRIFLLNSDTEIKGVYSENMGLSWILLPATPQEIEQAFKIPEKGINNACITMAIFTGVGGTLLGLL